MLAGNRLAPLFLGFLFGILLATPLRADNSASTQWTVIQRNGRDYVPLTEVAAFYHFNLVNITRQLATLVQPGRILQGQPGARDLFINNLRFFLAQPLLDDQGNILISRNDLAKIVEPVLRPWLIPAPKVDTIILDPGHGGNDQGTWCIYGNEKSYSLDLAFRIRDILSAQGYQVVLTRTIDTYVSLDDRVNIASRYPRAVFVSLHFNSGPARGIETYCLAPQGVPSSDGHPEFTDLLLHSGNTLDSANLALATAVHGSILKRIHSPDRGIRRARFHVLRDISIPGILVEGGYLSGGDAYAIATGLYRQYLAKGIAEGIVRYLKAVPGQTMPPIPPVLVKANLPTPTPTPQTPDNSHVPSETPP